MPINLSNSPLSSIKLGDGNILKAYIGNGQMFPNNTEITAAAFTNSNIGNTGGTREYNVSGEIGSSFTLTGSVGATTPSGTQVISTSPSTYSIVISSQRETCGAGIRYPQVLITPQGNTVLAGGLSNTDTIQQAAGLPIIPNNVGLTISAINTARYTVNIGGQLYWAPNASFSVSVNYTVGAGGNTGISRLTVNSSFTGTMSSGSNPNGVGWTGTNGNTQPSNGAYWNNPDNLGGSLGSGGYNGTSITMLATQTPVASVSFNVTLSNAGCNRAAPLVIGTGSIYP